MPATLKSIGDYAFANNLLENIEIPSELVNIGNSAFSGNLLSNVNLPNEILNIGNSAFAENKLNNITLPNSLTHVGHNAFSYNEITSFTLPTPEKGGFLHWEDNLQNTFAGGTDISNFTHMYTLIFDDNARVLNISGTLNLNDVPIHTIKTDTFTITNNGFDALTINSIQLPEGFTANWTGGQIPKEGAQQEVMITFSPTFPHSYSSTITLISDKTSGDHIIPVIAKGVGSYISLTENISFDTIEVGSTQSLPLSIKNIGNEDLTVSNITVPENFTLPPKGEQDITVTFSPTTAQLFTGNITVESNKLGGENIIPISGGGIGSHISLTDSLEFNTVDINSHTTKTLTITNTGNQNLTVNNIKCPENFTANPINFIVPAGGGSQDIAITFVPTSAKYHRGNIKIESNKTTGADSIIVSGGGIGSHLSLPSELDFGNVIINELKITTFTIQNKGSQTLTISNIILPEPYAANLSTLLLSPGSSKEITVSFSPTQPKTYKSIIIVNSNKTSGNNIINIKGNGILYTGLDKPKTIHKEPLIFPNPITEHINIKSNNAIEELNIYELTGRLLKTLGFQNPRKTLKIEIEKSGKEIFYSYK